MLKIPLKNGKGRHHLSSTMVLVSMFLNQFSKKFLILFIQLLESDTSLKNHQEVTIGNHVLKYHLTKMLLDLKSN